MKLLVRFLSNFGGLGKVNRVIFFGLRQRKLLNSLKIGCGPPRLGLLIYI